MKEINKELFDKVALEVEKSYGMWGLSGWLYQDYAEDILKKYINEVNK